MIAYDIDGVWVSFLGDIFKPAAKAVLGVDIDLSDCTKWNLNQYGVSDEELDTLFTHPKTMEFYRNAPLIPNAAKLIPTVSPSSVFLTSRGADDLWSESDKLLVRAATRYCLEQHGLHNHVYFVRGSEKAQWAADHGVTLMWEDNAKTVEALAEVGVLVMMPDYPYNKHVSGENIVRLEGWANHG